ncbi:MAG TPA: hypothetical protein VG186_13545 [Solirubrobacteraceae bacterium]|nr:hypothetical protein [Solirubrobacteraceae bacterium]
MAKRIHGTALMVALLAVLALPAGARAGDYTIHNCPGSLAPNNDAGAWRSYATGSLPSVGGYQGSCTPNGYLGAAIGWYANEESFNESLGAELQTPSSAISIVSLRLVWAGTEKTSGSDTYGQVNSDTGSEFAQVAPFGATASAPTVVDFPDGTHAVYVDSFCTTDGSTNCYFAANTTAVIELMGMDTTLSESTPPSATITGGSLAGGGPLSGTGTLDFTATDGESGVAASQLLIDGSPVLTDSYSSQCPFTNFAACPASMPDSIAWSTTTVADGPHQLALRITDAAGNVQTVDDHTVIVSNPTITPVVRKPGEVGARFVVRWRWQGRRTRLVSIRAKHLPRRAAVKVVCQGGGCPKLRAGAVAASRLRKALQGRVFAAGDRLELTITEAGHSPERIRFRIRDGLRPVAKLL